MDKQSSRRWRGRVALTASLLLVAVVVLAWFLPARWALPWLTPRLHGLRLAQVSGLVWQGRAGEVRLADGRLLGTASWQVSRRVLWSPQPLHLQLRGPQLALEASALKAGEDVIWKGVHLRADLALWRPRRAPSLGLPRGEWTMQIDRAQLQAGWPVQAAWHARWRDAALLTRVGTVALGTFDVSGSARAGVIDARLDDDGDGPLQATGNLRLTPLGWRLQARLRARSADPVLHRWLATLGKPDADGTVHLQRVGGLAAPAAPASVTLAATTKGTP